MRAYCIGCKKWAEDIEEYVHEAAHDVQEGETPLTPSQWVAENEGTYNQDNGHFLCTPCYIEAGMPSSPWGWTAP